MIYLAKYKMSPMQQQFNATVFTCWSAPKFLGRPNAIFVFIFFLNPYHLKSNFHLLNMKVCETC